MNRLLVLFFIVLLSISVFAIDPFRPRTDIDLQGRYSIWNVTMLNVSEIYLGGSLLVSGGNGSGNVSSWECPDGQFAQNYTDSVQCAAAAGSGDITGVSVGYGLLGGGASGSVTIIVDNGTNINKDNTSWINTNEADPYFDNASIAIPSSQITDAQEAFPNATTTKNESIFISMSQVLALVNSTQCSGTDKLTNITLNDSGLYAVCGADIDTRVENGSIEITSSQISDAQQAFPNATTTRNESIFISMSQVQALVNSSQCSGTDKLTNITLNDSGLYTVCSADVDTNIANESIVIATSQVTNLDTIISGIQTNVSDNNNTLNLNLTAIWNNFANFMQNLVDDTTPELGGTLNLSVYNITSSNGNVIRHNETDIIIGG